MPLAARTPRTRNRRVPALRTYPVLPLRGLAVFPGVRLVLRVGRTVSLQALAAAASGDGTVFCCAQRDPDCDAPTPADLHTLGTLVAVRPQGRQGGVVHVEAEGLQRARVVRLEAAGTGLVAHVEPLAEEAVGDDPEVHSLAQALLGRYQRLRGHDTGLPPLEQPGRLCDAIASAVLREGEQRQEILDALAVRDRLARLYRLLSRQLDAAAVERDVAERVRRQMSKVQREYYLREQLKAIVEELGEEGGAETAGLRARLRQAELPPEVRQRAERELQRLEQLPPLAAEAGVGATYLEWLLELPWLQTGPQRADLEAVQRALDRGHHGLDEAKERILEYLAACELRARAGAAAAVRGPVLCLAGPPGAGKTSLARCIAESLGRPLVRIALGGVRDEAEIRGHRRTYVGALPGRLIQGLRQAGRRDALILLDEIDKIGADYRGDPSAALLEVLDPEQNRQFRDHYLELPFDLSGALFLCTANTLAPLPRPLLDRLEVIHLPGYSEAEKLAIARTHLLPRQMAETGLPAGALRVSDGALRAVTAGYTREAGVRGLERQLGAICRKVARRVLQQPAAVVQVTARNLPEYLGRPRVYRQDPPRRPEVGCAVGLAWTETGGELLPIEVGVLPGSGGVRLTGMLGEVMRESAQAALTFVRTRAADWGVPPDFFARSELHVHAPEGAVPKDGPSAGITLAAAMLSAACGVPVRADLALTGEITLRGRVLPVGGVREKVLAARRAGLHRVVLPEGNRPDWEGLAAAALGGLQATFVERADQALACALGRRRTG